MTLQEILSEVQTITGKLGSTHEPLIKGAIQRAILSCHASAFFRNDLVDVNIEGFAVDTSTYKFTGNLPERFRKEKAVSAHYADGSVDRDFTIADEDNLTDYFGCPIPKLVIFMGRNVTVNYCGSPTALQLRYYSFPEIDMEAMTTNSWIVESYPTPIIHKAAYNVFAASGDSEGRTWQGNLYDESKQELVDNFGDV